MKVALVTGANRGIGFEIAKGLVKSGIKTILTARDDEAGLQAVQRIDSELISFFRLDIANNNDFNRLKSFIEPLESLDILINNAAINYDTWHSVSDADLENVKETLETNLLGTWRMIHAVLPKMKQKGFGRIVNVSSGAGSFGEGMGASAPGYSISKAALNVLTVKLAQELSSYDILVNSVCPGWVRTQMGGPGATRSPEKGAETPIWLAQLPAGGPNGKFFRDKMEIPF
ncbi:MAG: SDR family oxidoreductase [Flavobacteriales bacterium]|nr:SDR family oxidoreductase [Flavobacteriales bacterium]